jgi:translation initiation factor IF-3
MAREADLDLVEVSPNAVPPVCRILDYGKFLYDQAKKERGAGRHTHPELHEVRFKVKIGEHDLDMKVKRTEKFLKAGGKVKLSVMFRGREIVHPDIGMKLLERARDNLQDIAVVEKQPTMEGRFMNMILGPQAVSKPPAPSKPKAARKPAAAKVETATATATEEAPVAATVKTEEAPAAAPAKTEEAPAAAPAKTEEAPAAAPAKTEEAPAVATVEVASEG